MLPFTNFNLTCSSIKMTCNNSSNGFLFNFQVESDRCSGEEKVIDSGTNKQEFERGCEVVLLQWHHDTLSLMESERCLTSATTSGAELKYVDLNRIPPNLVDSCQPPLPGLDLPSLLDLCDNKHSDLIPGTYEGGLKVWECAFDLITFFKETGVNFSDKSVMELGCGVGLPGIYSATTGADCVHFQDYNSEVIHYVTIPSLLSNLEGNDAVGKCRFYSGDWKSLSSVTCRRHYDIIMTSETIYSLDSQPRLLSVLKELSVPEAGVVYVAAKCVYFGVGGTVTGFRKMVEEDGTFKVEQVWSSQSSVPRVILKLLHKR